jgi:hypothetical protein
MPSPETHNPLLINYFEFSLKKIPNIVYFCQAANLPGMEFGEVDQPTIFSHPIKVPVGAVRFEPLLISFKVDENLNNWLEIHNWIKDNCNYQGNDIKNSYENQASDATLLITNSTYKPKIKVNFRRIFPTKLSGIQFNTVTPDSMEATATVAFSYTDYIIERI